MSGPSAQPGTPYRTTRSAMSATAWSWTRWTARPRTVPSSASGPSSTTPASSGTSRPDSRLRPREEPPAVQIENQIIPNGRWQLPGREQLPTLRDDGHRSRLRRRRLRRLLTEYHRSIYGDPSIGGDDPG